MLIVVLSFCHKLTRLNAQAKGKKRKGDDIDPNDPNAPKSKKAKAAAKPTKGRFKGPFNPDRHCGVINDKNLPCSRSLTCKSHSMGAKRAVQGRSKDYDELLLEWNRAHNPNWVEPVKRESKKERKEKKEREKRERKQRELEELALLAFTLFALLFLLAFLLALTLDGLDPVWVM